MSKDQRAWVWIGASTVALGLTLGSMIFFRQGEIETAEQEVSTLKAQIRSARKTVMATSGLEEEVIVLREVANAIDQILPGEEDLNGLNDDFHRYATNASVRATAFKPKPDRGVSGAKLDFEKVVYTLNLEGGIFQFLDFLNRIETHHRFLAIPSFRVTSSTRQDLDNHGEARHQIQMDVETYTYSSKDALQPVRIEGYGRKRDLLSEEIGRRRKALTVGRYAYRGERGRRDPWIDPRVPELGDGEGWPVRDQLAKVDDLVAMMADVSRQWAAVEDTQEVLERMLKKDALLAMLGELDGELRRVSGEGVITYVPALRRLESEVYEPRALLADELESGPATGLTMIELRVIQNQMISHIDHGEYSLALQVYVPMRSELDFIASDPVRNEVAMLIHDLALEAETLRDFNEIQLKFSGSFFIGERAAIVINGRPRTVGDAPQPGLEIADIRKNEVDFYFRGFVLTRVY